MSPYAWLFIIVFCLIVEAMTMGLTTIWFAIGGVAGFIAALCGLNWFPQWLIFVAVSFLVLLIVRPFAKKILKPNKEVRMNADSLIGKKALVTKTINNKKGFGEAAIEGKYWSAVSRDEAMIIDPGQTVVVDEIQGVKLIVHPIDE